MNLPRLFLRSIIVTPIAIWKTIWSDASTPEKSTKSPSAIPPRAQRLLEASARDQVGLFLALACVALCWDSFAVGVRGAVQSGRYRHTCPRIIRVADRSTIAS